MARTAILTVGMLLLVGAVLGVEKKTRNKRETKAEEIAAMLTPFMEDISPKAKKYIVENSNITPLVREYISRRGYSNRRALNKKAFYIIKPKKEDDDSLEEKVRLLEALERKGGKWGRRLDVRELHSVKIDGKELLIATLKPQDEGDNLAFYCNDGGGYRQLGGWHRGPVGHYFYSLVNLSREGPVLVSLGVAYGGSGAPYALFKLNEDCELEEVLDIGGWHGDHQFMDLDNDGILEVIYIKAEWLKGIGGPIGKRIIYKWNGKGFDADGWFYHLEWY